MAITVRNWAPSIGASSFARLQPASGQVWIAPYMVPPGAGWNIQTDGTHDIRMMNSGRVAAGYPIVSTNAVFIGGATGGSPTITLVATLVRLDDQMTVTGGGTVNLALANGASVTVQPTGSEVWHIPASSDSTAVDGTWGGNSIPVGSNFGNNLQLANVYATNGSTFVRTNNTGGVIDLAYAYVRMDQALTITVSNLSNSTTLQPGAGTAIAMMSWTDSVFCPRDGTSTNSSQITHGQQAGTSAFYIHIPGPFLTNTEYAVISGGNCTVAYTTVTN